MKNREANTLQNRVSSFSAVEDDAPYLSTSSSYPDPNLPLKLDAEETLRLTANDFVSNRAIILGQTGAGKGNAWALIAEYLLEHGLPMTIIDLEGEAYSLREICSTLLVVGRSAHADREYGPEQMGRLAELSVERGFSVVLDLSGYEEEEYYTLLLPYLRGLWAACDRIRTPYHLVMDEVHELVPQSGKTPVKQILIRMAKRGRKRGLGTLAMSQETASVDNQLLKQTQIRILLAVSYDADFDRYQRLIPRLSRAAIEETVPELPPGKGFVVFKHKTSLVQLLPRRTYDPSHTPKLGTNVSEPTLQTIDKTTLSLLDEQLPDSLEEKPDHLDRDQLLRLVRDLQGRIGQKPQRAEENVKRDEVAQAERASLLQHIEHLQEQLGKQTREMAKISGAERTEIQHAGANLLTEREAEIQRLHEQIKLLSQIKVTLDGKRFSLTELPSALHLDKLTIQHVIIEGEQIQYHAESQKNKRQDERSRTAKSIARVEQRQNSARTLSEEEAARYEQFKTGLTKLARSSERTVLAYAILRAVAQNPTGEMMRADVLFAIQKSASQIRARKVEALLTSKRMLAISRHGKSHAIYYRSLLQERLITLLPGRNLAEIRQLTINLFD